MDKKLWNLLKKEIERQEECLNLIPSENLIDIETMLLVGSPLSNKYAEGYVGKRYYPGNKYVDEIESLAKKRALMAFKLDPNVWDVNVQPYSGSIANLAVYLAFLKPGDLIMGFDLFSGGHLTHGHIANYSGKLFRSIQYKINPKNEILDYKEIERLALKYRPKIIVSGTTSYPRKINFERIYKIAKKVNAYHLADISHIAGLVISNLHPSPFGFADIVTMTTHKTLKGPRGAVIFAKKELMEKINKSVFPGLQGGPHVNIIAGICHAFGKSLKKEFLKYQNQILRNAKSLANNLKNLGFKLYTGGTDNHLMIIDLKPINLDGLKAERLLEEANIIANRNSLPKDASPFNPSGIRLGTPIVTARGLKEKEMKIIADFIYRILIKKEKSEKVKNDVKNLLRKFPLDYKNFYLHNIEN